MTSKMLSKFAAVLFAIATVPVSAGFAQVTVKAVAAPPGLVSALKSKDAAARRDAANRLGGMRARDAVRPLIEALMDKDTSVREAAAFALGQIADRRANEPLLSALREKDEEVRATIVFALGMLGERKSIKVLSNLLEDTSAAVRSSATVALGLMQDGDAVDEIIDILDDPSLDVRYDAVWALAQIGEPDALDHMKTVLVNLDLVKVDDTALEGLRQAVQNSMEILQAKSELRSARKRRASATSQSSGGSGKVTYSMELHPARIVQSVQPAPTERAVRAQIRGTVGIRVLVSADGRAVRAYVIRRLGYGLDQRAVEAAMQYKFEPAMQAGLPQTTWMELEIKY